MALSFLDMASGVGAMASGFGDLVGALGSNGGASGIEGLLGARDIFNPQEPIPEELIGELIAQSRRTEKRLNAAESDRAITTQKRTTALDRSQQLLAAGLDPNSDLFKRLLAEETQNSRRDFTGALNDYRNHMRRYGMGIVNPERRDEAVAQAASRGFEDIQSKARDRVRAYLASTAQQNAAVAGTYSSGGSVGGQTGGAASAAQMMTVNDKSKSDSRESGFANLVSGLQGLSKPTGTSWPGQANQGGGIINAGGTGGGTWMNPDGI